MPQYILKLVITIGGKTERKMMIVNQSTAKKAQQFVISETRKEIEKQSDKETADKAEVLVGYRRFRQKEQVFTFNQKKRKAREEKK